MFGIQGGHVFLQFFHRTGLIRELTGKPFQAFVVSAEHSIARQIGCNDLVVIVGSSHRIQVLLYNIQLFNVSFILLSAQLQLVIEYFEIDNQGSFVI